MNHVPSYRFGALMILVAVAGCATKPEIHLSEQPVRVPADQVENYWIELQPKYRYTVENPQALSPDMPCGNVTVEYVIDSNGHLFISEILESEPPGRYDWSVSQLQQMRRFKAAPGNANLTPVRSTVTTAFQPESKDCPSHENHADISGDGGINTTRAAPSTTQ